MMYNFIISLTLLDKLTFNIYPLHRSILSLSLFLFSREKAWYNEGAIVEISSFIVILNSYS